MIKFILSMFVLTSLSVSALELNTVDFTCSPPGHTGVSMEGSHTTETILKNSKVLVLSTRIKIKKISFITNGSQESSVPAFEAFTRVNESDDFFGIYSHYKKTTSKKVHTIELYVTDRNNKQSDTLVKTSDGKKFFSSCNWDFGF